MPDKPKRRKNNKNKRKNKGQYQQNNNTSNATEKNKQTSLEQGEQGDLRENDKNTVLHEEFVDENDVTKILSTAAEATRTDQITKITDSSCTETAELVSNIRGTKENENKDLLDKYKVESPEKPIKNKQKLRTELKSKSLDNDNQPTIVEIFDDVDKNEPKNELFQVNTSNILITECDPDVEWELTDDLKDSKLMHDEHPIPGALSITTIPLNIAECEEIKSMSPEEEKSLRQYLYSLNLSTNIVDSDSLEAKTELDQINNQEIKQRAKKGLAEGSFIPRPRPSRSLHVIDEEVSGESTAASCRNSYLSDKKSDNEDLDDDVFYSAKDVKLKMCLSNKQKSCGNLIPQECIRVDAQIKDPDITEAKGTWTTTTVEKMTGAEIVYLTDSSSSTSSIYDNNDAEENNEESDVSVRIITPTIEVVDTDNFLKNNFASAPIKSKDDNEFRTIKELESIKKSVNNLHHEEDQPEIDGNINYEENEIVVLSTDNINTDLYVKEIDTYHSIPSINMKKDSQNKTSEPKVVDNYDLKIKVLKCELNVAINNLIKEVVSDSDTTQDIQNDSLVRQDSSSSVGSSQCTAKYNPKCSSLNDVSGTEFDDTDTSNDCKLLDITNSHVKDVTENIEDLKLYMGIKTNLVPIPSLRDICLETIHKLPYGEQILEELACVSERLQKMNDQTGSLINLSKITTNNLDKNKVRNPVKINTSDNKNMIPPPLQPRQSSLKIICDDSLNVIPKKSETKRYCLSPSQKMLMDKLNTSVVTKTTDSLEENPKCADKKVTPDIVKDNTFGIPFKSQTGSRLLALLRNPSLAVNSREQLISEGNKKLGYSENISSFHETSTKNKQNNDISISEDLSIKQNKERHSLNKNYNYFKPKPIPRKFSSSFYESDESSDFVENSFKSTKNHKQYFHFSTGNLNQEIEDDISSIQNMHRHFNDVYKQVREGMYPRRPSLPKDLTDRQMEYICRKEKEVEAEIYRLETEQIRTSAKRGPRAPMLVDNKESPNSSLTLFNRIRSSQSVGVLPSLINPDPEKLSSVFSKSQEELLRNKMYSEYVSQMAEREERKQNKIIKITKTPCSLKNNTYSKSSSELNILNSQANNRIEKEFIDKAKERWTKLGIKDPETEDESAKNYYMEPKVVDHKIKVIDSGEEKDVQKLPNHLQDFVMFTAKDKSDKMDIPGESESHETSSHGVILCAVIILILTITNYVVRLFRRQ